MENDPSAFYQGMQKVVDDVRSGKGPVLVEALTLRLGGHAGVGFSKQLTAEETGSGQGRLARAQNPG